MSFWKKLFEVESKPFEFDPEEVKAKTESELNLLNDVRYYHDQKKYELALLKLLSFLEEYPERDQFALFTASTILRSYLRDMSTNTISEIANPILWDQRFDNVFMSCYSCHACWVPAPMSRGSFYRYANNIEPSKLNTCPKCGAKSIRVGRERKSS